MYFAVILGLLSIFKKSQASSPYEALNSVCLSKVERDVRPSVQMRQKLMTFSRVSTGDSDMPSSCEMKDDPEFKPVHEIVFSLESEPLGVHSTSDRKHKVPLINLVLR